MHINAGDSVVRLGYKLVSGIGLRVLSLGNSQCHCLLFGNSQTLIRVKKERFLFIPQFFFPPSRLVSGP